MDDVVFELVHTSLDHAPSYETVSYVWGNAVERRNIRLKGGTSLSITQSLHSALSYLIERCHTGHLWIDQICINQDNILERSAQVSIMGQIYSGGSMNLIWLGHDNDATPLLRDLLTYLDPTIGKILLPVGEALKSWAPELLAQLDDSMKQQMCLDILQDSQTDAMWDWMVTKAADLGNRAEVSDDDSDANMFKAALEVRRMLYDLLNRPWFTRAWILQEAILSKQNEFLIGGLHVTRGVLDLVLMMATNMFKEREPLRSIRLAPHFDTSGWSTLTCTDDSGLTKSGMSLYEVLCIVHCDGIRGQMECTDPRDLIYSLLGFCSDRSENPKVDYHLPLRAILVNVFWGIICRRRDLDHLAMCNGVCVETRADKQILDLPTWVPDWTQSPNNIFVEPPSKLRPGLAAWKPSKFAHHACDVVSHDSQLHVRGKRVGTVTYCFSPELHENLVNLWADTPFGAEYCAKYLDAVRTSLLSADELHQSAADVSRLLRTVLHWACFQQRRKGYSTNTWEQDDEYYTSLLINLFENCRNKNFPRSQHLSDTVDPEAYKDEGSRRARLAREFNGNEKLRCEHGKSLIQAWDGDCEVDCNLFHLRVWPEITIALKSSKGRTILLSDRGEYLISNPNASSGDSVCILHGCRYPVLLRKLRSGEYQFVGGCFIEGGIDGASNKVYWEENEADRFVLV